MSEIPTAEEILQKYVPNRYPTKNPWIDAMIEFAKLHANKLALIIINNSQIPHEFFDGITDEYLKNDIK